MSPLEEPRSVALSSLSPNGLLWHCCRRNGTMFCLRELISLRGPRRQELETTDPTRLLALCQGQLRDRPIGSVDALCIQGRVAPCLCRATPALDPCPSIFLCHRAFLLADLSIPPPPFNVIMYPKAQKPGITGYVSASVLAGRNRY